MNDKTSQTSQTSLDCKYKRSLFWALLCFKNWNFMVSVISISTISFPPYFSCVEYKAMRKDAKFAFVTFFLALLLCWRYLVIQLLKTQSKFWGKLIFCFLFCKILCHHNSKAFSYLILPTFSWSTEKEGECCWNSKKD